MFLHVFRHINADQGLLCTENCLGECFGKFCFSDTGRSKRKDPVGRFGSFNPTLPRFTAFATAVTASSWPTTRLWSVCSSLARRFDSPFRETLYRNFRPGGYGFCDFFFCYLQFFVFATAFKAFSDLLQIFFELLLARLQFFCLLKIAGTDRGFFFFLYFEQCLLLFLPCCPAPGSRRAVRLRMPHRSDRWLYPAGSGR